MDSAKQLALRTAKPSDCRFVWEINNHPSVRERSVNTEAIAWTEHKDWFAHVLDDGDRILLIAEDASGRIGVVRFALDREEACATISVALQPQSRGAGQGRRLIAEASRELLSGDDCSRVIAWIRTDNVASQRAFRAAGFVPAGSETRGDTELACYEFTLN